MLSVLLLRGGVVRAAPLSLLAWVFNDQNLFF